MIRLISSEEGGVSRDNSVVAAQCGVSGGQATRGKPPLLDWEEEGDSHMLAGRLSCYMSLILLVAHLTVAIEGAFWPFSDEVESVWQKRGSWRQFESCPAARE